MASLDERILNLAESRHAARCGKVHGDDWHIRNDYLKDAARDVIAGAQTEISRVANKYGVRA